MHECWDYPRFEHTLGVVQQAQRLIDAVNGRYPPKAPPFECETVRNLRLAALFHDCGHSCFSHISEEVFRSCPDMTALFESGGFPECNPHEAFSALILKSEPVKQFIRELEVANKIVLDPDSAADYIIGIPAGERQQHRYETQVINGPFDADKLDYIFRDAHYSGMPIGLDLERLWAACGTGDTEDGRTRVLTLHQAGVAPLEQVLFSKVNLFTTVYQHPEVRAAEKMLQSIIETAKKAPGGIQFMTAGRKLDLNRATGYLWLTDEMFLAGALRRKRDDPIRRRLHDIRDRHLFVRALTISNDTIGQCPDGFARLRKLNQKENTYEARRALAGAILQAANLDGKIDAGDVWVDLPACPSFEEAGRTYVHTASGSLRKMSELFPVHYWTEFFREHKWRGHVFCPREYQQRIHEAALEVLHGAYGLGFKKSAGETAHVSIPKATA